MALKAVPKATTTLKDFLLEFHYSYFLSPHHNILDTYDVAFETQDHYYFAQEIAPFGDLQQVSVCFVQIITQTNDYYVADPLMIYMQIFFCFIFNFYEKRVEVIVCFFLFSFIFSSFQNHSIIL